MKNSTRIILAILLALGVTGHAPKANAKAKAYKGLDPEMMMTMKDMKIMGITLTMTMSEIIATLEGQGLKPDCSKGIACLVRTDTINLNILHKSRSKANKRMKSIPVDPNALPVAIGFGQVNGNPANCAVVDSAIKKFCAGSDGRQPCWTDNFGKTTGQLGASGYSSDGYSYSGTISQKPGTLCAIRVERHPSSGQ